MKYLNYVVIQPHYGLWSSENHQKIVDQSRALGICLGNELKKYKFKFDDFTGLFYEGSINNCSSPLKVSPTKLLVIPVIFNELKYDSCKNDNDINRFLIEIIHQGNEKIIDKYKDLALTINNIIANFEKDNFAYNWNFYKKKLSIKDDKILINLDCFINIHKFKLLITIYRNDDLFYKNTIFQCEPNEFVFKHRFKKVDIQEGFLIIYDSFGRLVYRLNLIDLKPEMDKILLL